MIFDMNLVFFDNKAIPTTPATLTSPTIVDLGPLPPGYDAGGTGRDLYLHAHMRDFAGGAYRIVMETSDNLSSGWVTCLDTGELAAPFRTDFRMPVQSKRYLRVKGTSSGSPSLPGKLLVGIVFDRDSQPVFRTNWSY